MRAILWKQKYRSVGALSKKLVTDEDVKEKNRDKKNSAIPWALNFFTATAAGFLSVQRHLVDVDCFKHTA